MKNTLSNFKNEKGVIPLLLLTAAIGLILFLIVTSLFSFKNGFNFLLFAKKFLFASGGVVDLSIAPSIIKVSQNDSFVVDINMDTKTDTVSAAQIQINYNPNFLQATGIQAGAYLPVVLTPGALANGSVSIILGSNPDSPKIGTGTLASVTFKALQPSTPTTQISFDVTNTQVASIGQTVNRVGNLNSSDVTVNATIDLTPPTVSITSPTDGATVPRNSDITITANASDNVAVAKLEFYIDSLLKCTDTTTPYTCTTKIGGKSRVKHTIMVKAYDTSNNPASASITVTAK